MGKKSWKKGWRAENQIVHKLQEANIEAKRVPLSGSTEFAKGDVVFKGKTAEVKIRKQGFRTLYKFLSGNDVLFVREDRKPFLAVLTIDDYISLLKAGSKE